jgi:hypothetical protein
MIVKTLKAFNTAVEALELAPDGYGEVTLRSRDKNTKVKRSQMLYQVYQLDVNGEALSVENHSKARFEQNFRWYI